MRPILLLDVDCVLAPSPFNRATTRDWLWEPPIVSDEISGGFTLHLSREMAAEVVGLGCDIRWLTTWAHDASRNIGAHFGWPEHPVAATPKSPGLDLPFSYWKHIPLWKPRAAFDILANPGPPVVWIDDDIGTFLDLPYESRLGRELDPHDRLLAIAPVYDTGITRAHIAEVREFLAGRGY